MDGRTGGRTLQETIGSKNPVEQVMHGFSCECMLSSCRKESSRFGGDRDIMSSAWNAQQAGFRDMERWLPAVNDFFC
jgi:hypothetical protein